MARLPKPGSDNNAWGTILNSFLSVEHNADGTLKKASQISQAQSDASTALSTANSKYTKPTSGIPVGDFTSSVQLSLGKADSSVQTVDGLTGTVTLKNKYIAAPASFAHDKWAGKANANLSGTVSDGGQTWQTTGTTAMQIMNGMVSLAANTVGAGYAQLALAANVWQVGAEYVFDTGGTTTTGAITILVAKDSSLSLSDLACHLVVNPTNWVFQVRTGSGSLVTLASGTFTTPLTQDGSTIYRSTATFLANTVYLTLPDGEIAIVTDARIGANLSGAAIWEIVTNASTDSMPAFTRVWASTNPNGEVPFTVDTSWIRALNLLSNRTVDPATANVRSQGGTANEVAIGNIDGVPGISMNGDLIFYRVGANTISINSATIMASTLVHTGAALGFYGAAATARPVLSYSRATETTAMAQIRQALTALGLVTDNTTA